MQYGLKVIKDLTDDELSAAQVNVAGMWEKFIKARNDPKFIKKMQNQKPPEVNQNFIQLKSLIEIEIATRKESKTNV